MESRLEAIVTRFVVEHGVDQAYNEIERLVVGRASKEQRDAARAEFSNSSSIGFDDDALVSEAEQGYWVQGWLWVDYPWCKLCDEAHAPGAHADCGTCEGAHDPTLDCRAAYPPKGA